MHIPRRPWMVLPLAAALLAGCKSGPDYLRPDPQPSDHWIDAGQPRLNGQADTATQWWTAFGDEHLNRLVDQATDQNLTLKQACLRVAEARYLRGVTVGGWFPQTQQASGHLERRQRSLNTANVFPAQGQRAFGQVAVGLDAAWELDFWGRFQRSIEAADAELDASVHAYDDALVVLLGDVANTYIEIRTLEQRIQLAEQNLQLQRDTLALVQKKYSAGLVSELDVSQSHLNLYQTEALIPTLKILHRQATNQLCVLMGKPPADLSEMLGWGTQIPVPPSDIALGIPADLLRQRPDIRQAERQLAAQSAKIGVAQSEFYPHISIAGTLSVQSRDVSSLFQTGSVGGAVGPNFRWNILNYGRIKNNVLMQDAAFQRLAYAYQQSVLEANREVEDGLVAFVQSYERIAALDKTVQASKRSVELSYLQYQVGAVDFNRVFQSQTEQVKHQDQLAIARGDLAKSLVSVYRALGGGWQIRLCKPTVTELTAGLGPESVPDATGAAAPLVSSNSSATGAPDAQAATTEAARGPQPLRTALQESPWQENSLRTN